MLMGILLANVRLENVTQASADAETRVAFSQKIVSPFTAIEKSETNLVLSINFRQITQKRGIDSPNYSLAVKFRKLPDHIIRITNSFQKSTSLFLIYHNSISLFKVFLQ